MNSSPQWTLLARILRPQGRKGEVLADLFTDFPERFAEHPEVWLAPDGFAERPVGVQAEPEPTAVQAYWLPVGRNLGRVVLHFAAIDSINDAEKLSGKEVVVPASERLPLSDGSVYLADLIGCTVFDGDVSLGIVAEVQFPTTPDGARRLEDAAALLVVTPPDGGELLIPFVNAYIDELDLPAKTLHMHLPQGLTEINLN